MPYICAINVEPIPNLLHRSCGSRPGLAPDYLTSPFLLQFEAALPKRLVEARSRQLRKNASDM